MKIIYYPDHRAVYYAQDKNASTTLVAALEKAVSCRPLIYRDHTDLAPSPEAVRDRIFASPIDFQFTIVRNTWDRLASLYHMLLLQPQKEWKGKPKGELHPWFRRHQEAILDAFSSERPFYEFIRFVCGQSDREVDSHWRPQHWALPLAEQNFFLGRMESLDRDYACVLDRMGLEQRPLTYSSNRTSHIRGHYANDYDPETIRTVARRYQDEIRLFAFTFRALGEHRGSSGFPEWTLDELLSIENRTATAGLE